MLDEHPVEVERKVPKDKISFKLKRLMQSEDIPGLAAIHWIRGERKAYYLGKASVADDIKVSADTVFPMASLSKPLCAIAVLYLVRQKKLSLDKPIVDYIPRDKLALFLGKPFTDPRIKQITARMLLCHTSGFPNWRGEPRHWQKARQRVIINFTPGSQFGYSGEGFQLLALSIEEISGKTFNEFIKETVFIPFGMQNSSFIWQSDYETTAAQPHDFLKTVKIFKPQEPIAAASLHATLDDYCRFLQNVLGLLRTDVFKDILSAQQAKTVFFNLGFGIMRTIYDTLLWHWGDDGLFKAFFISDPSQKELLVYCANSQMGLGIWNQIVKLTLGQEYPLTHFPILENYLKFRPCITNNPVRYTTVALSQGIFRTQAQSEQHTPDLILRSKL